MLRLAAVAFLGPALLATVLVAPSRAGASLATAIGDSITVGADDERLPDDDCQPGPPAAFDWVVGWRGILECRLPQLDLASHAGGGWSSYVGAVRIDEVLAGLGLQDDAFLSLHVNDCGPLTCGSVCLGGARDGLPCRSFVPEDCPGAGALCDSSGAHPCTSAETRANLKTIIDAALGAGYQTIYFWKSPGHVGTLSAGSACGNGQFDGSADALDTLFLSDPRPTGYADEPRVAYVEETFADFCVGSGLQGCPPDDGLGDRRQWWFAKDAVSTSRGEGSKHVHPNAWGYMELAAKLASRLTGAPANQRPPRPAVTVAAVTHTSVAISVPAVVDPDGDPVTIHAWAACADTRGESADPACDGPVDALDTGPFLPRECGALSGSDHDGPGTGNEPNPGFAERHRIELGGGLAVLDGLHPDTTYRICAVAYDGLQGSWFDDSQVVTTPAYLCDNGLDDDGDGLTDFPDDPGCAAATDNSERAWACGLGYELTVPLLLLGRLFRKNAPTRVSPS